VAGTPMQRMGDPVADIGGAVMLLLGDAGRFLTGHVLYADGGQHLTPSPFEAVVPTL
jgi:NAD(P)-dependent dehydrogenase (short-subunit alcohol dehydrogenase family)